MPMVMVDGLDLDKSEALLVAWSPSGRVWLASVGNLEAEDQRELERGDSPAEALGLLFMRLGVGKIGGAS